MWATSFCNLSNVYGTIVSFPTVIKPCLISGFFEKIVLYGKKRCD